MTKGKDDKPVPPSPADKAAESRCSSAPARRRISALAGAVLFLALGILVLLLFDPSETRMFPRCPFFALTGLKCPGCGTARALHAALSGRFAEALRFNLALPVMVGLLACCLAFPRRTQSPFFVWAVISLVVLWGVVRNVIGM